MERKLRDHGHITNHDRSSAIRSARPEDLANIVSIHQQAFQQFFLTRLGSEFLRLYYGLVLAYDAGIILVDDHEGALQGFVSGFLDPAEFYRLMWRRKSMFVMPALPALLRQPALIVKVLEGMQRIQTSASSGPARSCELSSIAVTPGASGLGLGRMLVQAFLKRSWSMNAECVYLTTDADANEHANRLYRDAGFRHSRKFLQGKGRWMNEYVIHRSVPNEG